MGWRQQRETQAYPDDTGVRLRALTMPVGARPDSDQSPRRRRPVPECGACDQEPCGRHGYDVMASLGARPPQPGSPDERVKDWKAVR